MTEKTIIKILREINEAICIALKDEDMATDPESIEYYHGLSDGLNNAKMIIKKYGDEWKGQRP